MNHFKGKQFQKDVIIVAVGYYLRYNLNYCEVQEYSRIDSPSIRGKCMKLILKSKDPGIISIEPLIRTD